MISRKYPKIKVRHCVKVLSLFAFLFALLLFLMLQKHWKENNFLDANQGTDIQVNSSPVFPSDEEPLPSEGEADSEIQSYSHLDSIFALSRVKEFEFPLSLEFSDLTWTCVSEQVPDTFSANQSYLVWIPDIEGPKDVVVMMHTNKNRLESTGFPTDWVQHTYWDNGHSWEIGDALAAMAEEHPFILISPNYTCWADKKIPRDMAGTDFLNPEIHIKFLLDVCSKFETYADPTEESILENRSHFLLGGGSLGGNWTSQGIVSGLSAFYGNFMIASDSTAMQMPLDKLFRSLKEIKVPTTVWCVNGSLEGEHTRKTWDFIKNESFDAASVRHISVLEGNHRYSTWLVGLREILSRKS